MVDPTLQERLSLLSRTFQNQRAKVQGDSMLFSDDIFAIEPVVSDSWDPPFLLLPEWGHLADPPHQLDVLREKTPGF